MHKPDTLRSRPDAQDVSLLHGKLRSVTTWQLKKPLKPAMRKNAKKSSTSFSSLKMLPSRVTSAKFIKWSKNWPHGRPEIGFSLRMTPASSLPKKKSTTTLSVLAKLFSPRKLSNPTERRSRLVALVCVHLKPLELRTLCVRSFEMREKDFDISFPHAFCRVLKM